MFSRLFTILNKLTFLGHPKLYLLSKFWICLCIILQRVVLFMYYQQEDQPLKSFFQVLTILIFITSEYLLLWFFSKRKPPERIQILSILLMHLFFSQLFIELAHLSFQTDERTTTEIFFQEIFFLNMALVIFTNSMILKNTLALYLAIISLYRLASLDSPLFYISWILMALVFVTLPIVIAFRKKEIKAPVKQVTSQGNKYLKLENALEGVALICKDREILFMNGLFKGLVEASNEKDALDKILKLKKVDTSASAQKPFLSEIKLKNSTGTITTSRKDQKSCMDLPKSTDHPTSLEAARSGSYVRRNFSPRPSIFQHRTSILQHRNSVFLPTPSINIRKGSRAHSSKGGEIPSNSDGLPLIKINLTRVQDDEKPWFGSDSESRSPLIHYPPEPMFGGDSFHYGGIKSSSRSIPHSSVIDSPPPEQVVLRFESTDRNSPRGDNVEALIDVAFTNMSRTSDRNQNLVITQLIENLASPLEVLKGHANSPTSGRGQDSTTLGNPCRDKFNVIFRDSKKGTRILEVVLCPFIYQQKECLCICTRDVSYEVKCEDLNESLEYRNKLLRFVSHEFRGPLNCSIALLDALKTQVHDEIRSKFVMPSLNSCKMLLNQANDILDHAQIQARKLKINIIPCKIKKVFKEIIEMIEIQALAQNIELKMRWDTRIPQRFYTDPNRLKQIVLNLVSNGLKYTNHGSITLQAIYISPTLCKISVIDTGVGISKENLKLLFQEFGKITHNSHLNPHGVGLGLVISKLLTLELGHDNEGLMVDSEEGRGSTFYFFLESKIDPDGEEVIDSDDCESLEENGSSLFSIIKTTYGNWENPTNRKSSIRRKAPSPQQLLEPSPRRESKLKTKTLSPVPLSKQEVPASKTALSIPQSKTVDNLESIMAAKKKSFDNMLALQKRTILPSPRVPYGKETKPALLRSYTIGGGDSGGRRSNTIKSDSEFLGLLKKVKHNCSSPKALLVDDSQFNLTALEALLSSTFGIESRSAMNGEEAINEVINNEQVCVKCKNFKVIFMDIEMPKYNGFETTQILRKKMLEGEISFIPIIGITGHNPNENRVQCLTSGMNDLVSKPVSPKILKELIIKWMGY